jgi:hypothetical protein
VIVGKNRDGPTGSVEIGFKAKTASFVNDGGAIETIDYVDEEYEEYEENLNPEASTKDSYGTIQNDTISMPLI